MECRSVSWGLANYNSAEPCSECRANRSDLAFTDLTASAPWRHTSNMSSAAYFARARAPVHPLLSGSFAWRFVAPLDVMHVCDCNGVASILGGSLIRPLVQGDPRLGSTQAERLASINSRLEAFYDSRPGYNRMPALRLQNLTADAGWAQLSGSTVKSAATRGLAPFFRGGR